MKSRLVFAVLLVACAGACGATQTDPPPRRVGAPNRDAAVANDAGDGGAGGIDASDDADTTVNIGEDSGSAPDARVDAAECTTTSIGSQPTPPAAGLILAAYSMSGFSGTQGKCGWSYGYVAPATSAAFVAMAEYDVTGEAWYVQNNVYWTWIGRSTAHPNGVTTSGGRTAVDHWAVRRWTSNFAGAIRVTGVVKKASGTAFGNGVIARVVIGTTTMFEQTIVDETGMTFDIAANASIDQTIDLVIDPNASEDGFDSTDATVAIWK